MSRRAASLTAWAVLALLTLTVMAGCSTTSGSASDPSPTSRATSSGGASGTAAAPGTAQNTAGPYSGTTSAKLSATAARARHLVYVPNQRGATVQVIDPATMKVVATYPVATSPEHVVPSHDLRTLWVNSDLGETLTAIDPTTGKITRRVPVADPYNLYFTPDGRHALVMAEWLRRIDVRDPQTMKLTRSLPVPCGGLNHADFTADLSTMLVSCEFSGKVLFVDADATKVLSIIDLNKIKTPGATATMPGMNGPAASLEKGATSMPQDVRLAPDGRHFVVADMMRSGVWIIDAATRAVVRFQPPARVHTASTRPATPPDCSSATVTPAA